MPRAETRLSQEEKDQWVRFCSQAGASEAELLRKMIMKVSGSPAPEERQAQEEPKSSKITVRLTNREKRKIQDRVKTEGYSTRTAWASAAVRAALHHEPVLTEREIMALRESNRELAAIGRNLNQMARAINIDWRESEKLKLDHIEKLAGRIEHHKDQVSELLDRNMNRWGNDG